MASTNKTTHYELSQYVGSDKPTYLSDYNTDMSNIDTGIYNAQTKADSGYNLANTADGKADTAITNAGTAQTNASTALTNIGTMANLDTTEKTNLVGAINEVNTKIDKFDISAFTSHSTSDVSSSQISNFGYAFIETALNSDQSIGKIYGMLDYTVTDGINKNVSITVSLPELYISNSFTIFPAGIAQINGGNITGVSMTLNTNNTITLSYYSESNGSGKIILTPSIYFLKDFGDPTVN